VISGDGVGMEMELYIIRHGESLGNIMPGKDMPDSPLTDLGKSQAEKVIHALKEVQDIEHIISSPLLRALQTAQPYARELNTPITVWKDICEYRTGSSYVGPKVIELIKEFPQAHFSDEIEPDGWIYKGNDNPYYASKRARNIIIKLKKNYQNSKIAIFSHGTFNNYLIKALLDLPASNNSTIQQDNACINWFTLLENDSIKINKINETTHLNC
jgi:broad specificity phosphatase PhoE